MAAPHRAEDLQFAELVVTQGLCSKEKVDECLSFIARLAAEGVTPPRLGELLARRGYLSSSHVEATLRPSGDRAPLAEPSLPPEARLASADASSLVGKYVKVSRLGAGGMGEVWRAWDRDLRRWVALKFLHYEDPAQLARFHREAQTAASLNHANIAAVYEVGEAGGKPFIAMQLIQGGTLASIPRDDARRVVALVRDAALAVHHAHEQGVIHRDLKPHNLMVEGTRVFVMDFGLAKPASVDSSLSAAGSILGTPAYMPPEQARGDAALVGPRSDVYALGATLYDLLAGTPPFDDSEVYALLKKVVEEEPVPLRKRNPRLDRELETIVMKCLEKDPERRYAGARELADDLARWLGGEAILAHPPSPAYRLRKFVHRRRAVVATGLGVAALALGILLLNVTAERSRRKSLAELTELRTQMLLLKEWTRQSFRKPEDIRSALDQQIEKVSGFVARHPGLPQGRYVRAQARVFEGRDEPAEEDLREAIRLDPNFAPAWALLARVKLDQYLARKEGQTEQEREANKRTYRPLLEEAMAALRKGWTEGADPVSVERWGLSRTPEDAVAEKLTTFIWTWFVEMRREKALADLKAANEAAPSEDYCIWLGICGPSLAEHLVWDDRAIQIAPHYAPAWRDRGFTRIDAKDLEGAIGDFNSLIAIDPRRADSYVSRASAWLLKQDFQKALADYSRAIELDRGLAEAWGDRAVVQLKLRDFDAAERDATEAIRLTPRQSIFHANRAAARLEKRDHAGAGADASKAIELDPQLSFGWINRATARFNQGDLEGASADLSKAFALAPIPPEAYLTRGALCLSQGDFDAAIEASTKALELDPSLALAHVNRAGGRLGKGDWDGAIEEAGRALELDPGHPMALLNRSNALLRKGDADAALADLDVVIEREPGYALAWVNRSAARLFRSEWDAAFRDASRAVELDPKLAMAWGNRASARFERGEWKEAVADAKKAVELDPKQPVTYVVLGLSLYELRELDMAIAALEQALRVAPPGWPSREEVEGKLKKVREEKN